MKVCYLFNNPVGHILEGLREGKTHDSHLYGMLRLRKQGVDTGYLEIERFVRPSVARWLRRHLLTMHYVHLPLFPLLFRYDVVVTSTAYTCMLLKAFFRIRSFKWVLLDFNVLGTIGSGTTLRQRLFAWAVSKVDGIVAISEAEANALKERFPHLRDNIIFLHEATDLAFFKPQLDVPEQDVVISVGMYGRDFDTVIKATEGLGVECRLATKLITPEQAKTLPKHVTVKVYGHTELLRAYNEAKVCYIGIEKPDDYYDSVGTFALIEAFAMGKATVATHMKSMESYLKDGENGVFVPHFDVEALRRALKDLLADDAQRRKLGANARRFAEAHVDPDLFAKNLATYLERFAAR